MSGTLKVGGVNLATHTGTDGTGNPVLDSGVVFPAGHVLQVQYISYGSPVVIANGTFTSVLHTSVLTITKIAGTKIFLYWSTQVGSASATNAYIEQSRIQRTDGNSDFSGTVVTLPGSPNVASQTYPAGFAGYSNTATQKSVGNLSHTTIDDSINGSAGTYYYRYQLKTGVTGTMTANGSAGLAGGIGIMQAMEVVA